jgi:hypothetical protein
MINIAQPNPAAWSPPASGAIAPVAAVAPVRPLQESARSGQSGSGREQDTPGARAERRADTQEVAGQGRDATGNGARNAARRKDTDTGTGNGTGIGAGGGGSSDLRARREAEQNAKQLATEQAGEEARRVQRQELLTNVWKASAAVVDRVLGLGEVTAVNPATESQAAPGDQQSMEQLSLPWPVMPQDPDASPSRAELGAPEDVVAYDERGNSSLAPLETGLLISHRV